MPTTMTQLAPSQWRVLNKLFYIGTQGQLGQAVPELIDKQIISPERLVQLETAALVAAHTGFLEPVQLADLQAANKALRLPHVKLLLASAGLGLVIRDRPNNVICMLGHQPRQTATAHALRGEAEIDDAGLIAMNDAGLIEPADSDIRLATLKQLPRDLKLRLTRKGRTYFPR